VLLLGLGLALVLVLVLVPVVLRPSIILLLHLHRVPLLVHLGLHHFLLFLYLSFIGLLAMLSCQKNTSVSGSGENHSGLNFLQNKYWIFYLPALYWIVVLARDVIPV
jgi:hypothetical protein